LSQPTPATAWEADVDALMQQISRSHDPHIRRRAFAQVQKIMARELPAMSFAFPRLSLAMSTRVDNATPAVFRPPVLWNPAALTVNDGVR
jgi:ABC-type transport system substrate-binding protein